MVLITEASSSSCSYSSPSSKEWKYDVFLNFRGEDIRKNFVSHLYKRLRDEGIITFKDDHSLETGQSISEALPKEIGESRILIIIFSKNYVSSTWCLNELVQILECKKAGRQIALPIFYNVTPGQVRKQCGDFREAFAVHEEHFKENIEKVERWRAAMTEAANLKGWELQDREETEFIEEIVKDINSKLEQFSSDIPKDLVGMESRIEKMRSYLDMGQSDKVKIIGVCGMGGIGKTTIASVVYKQMCSKFEGSSFLADVREASKRYDGLVSLQSKLLSAILNRDVKVQDVHKGTEDIRKKLRTKKVLVILDDVDEVKQLECLIGKRDENWFGKGSRIIITTRNRHLLDQHGVDDAYMLEELQADEAFELFFLKAFKNGCPTQDHEQLSFQFLRYASGLPLALSVLGSYLYAKSIEEWKSALEKLKEIPNEEILKKLEISLDGLDETEKKIFLDIACFFNGADENYVRKVLESCGFYPKIGIRELINRSLLTISDKTVWMHDLLQEMGRDIVRRECITECGQRSRIWLYEDLDHVLMNDTGSEKTQGIVLHLCHNGRQSIRAKGFTKMKCLRLLILQNEHNFEGLEYLSNELKYLEWREYPFKSFPSTFRPNKLVELHMPHSNLKQFWKAITPVESLKIINLSFSTKLIKTPDFSKFPNLEELNLQGCTRLVEVHQSIRVLRRLVSFNMQDCKNLVNLPDGMWNLQSLEIVNLGGCSKLFKRLGFNLSGCSKLFKRLGLVARQMRCFTALPSLMHLDLSYCNLPDGAIPNDMSCLQLLEYLNLSGNPILSIPSSICQLSKLKGLDLYDCTELKTLPDLPSNIERLSTSNCTSLRTLPPLVQLCKLENFQCTNCKSLQSVPDLPSSVQHLKMENCTALETLPNLFEKHNVEKNFFISFSNCSKLKYCQSKISVGFTWLRSYLLWLYDVRKLLKLQESCPSEAEFEENIFLKATIILHRRIPSATNLPCFYICFPGSRIPEWFEYQGEEGELRIKLPPDEDWGKIAGFAVCCVVEDGNVIEDNGWQIAVGTEGKPFSRWGNRVPAPGASQVRSDHLSLFFQVNHHLESNRECTPTELLLNFWPEGKIKNCGIRIVHDEEIEEMIRLNKALEDMGKVEEEDN